MDEDLLHDLSKYKSYRDKSVSSSAQSLIQLFREKNPQLLERKDRGKPTEFQRDLRPLNYAQNNPQQFLEGAETLDLIEQNDHLSDHDEQQQDEHLNEDEWINVPQSDDDDDEEEQEEEDKSIDDHGNEEMKEVNIH